MAQACIDTRAAAWPGAPVDAAHFFHREIVPQVREALRRGGVAADGAAASLGAIDAVVVILPPGDRAQRDWQVAAIRGLAREAAPGRVNGIRGAGEEAIGAAADWLAGAAAITGQLLEVAGNAGEAG